MLMAGEGAPNSTWGLNSFSSETRRGLSQAGDAHVWLSRRWAVEPLNELRNRSEHNFPPFPWEPPPTGTPGI